MELDLKSIEAAADRLTAVVQKTPLQYSKRLSQQYNAKVYIKREDLQEVRSFKIRGAYNRMAVMTSDETKRGVVTASAGNHAQGVAYGCSHLKIKGVIYMPVTTPNQKIEKVKNFGGRYAVIRLEGNTFDDANKAAQAYCKKQNAVYVHPFDDPYTIAGQGTVAKEVYEKLEGKLDYIITAEGGGGLTSGVSLYIKSKNPHIKVIAIEPSGAASLNASLPQGKVVSLETIDTFVDGAAVKTGGTLTFKICQEHVDKVMMVPEGKVCTTMIDLYQKDGIIAEPAGALSIAALDNLADKIKSKTVVCVLSGGNNDILRYPEIMERSLIYQGLKHYFILNFAQKPGQLRNFLNNALGPNDDIVLFEYIKKTNKEKGPALVGIELKDKKDLEPLIEKMTKIGLNFQKITPDDLTYHLLI